MRKFLLSLLVCFAGIFCAAQGYQVTNANFEDWSAAAFDGKPQATGWNASNVEQVGMKFNFAHKETGHNGGFCMMVQDQSVGAMGITETSPGYFSIGKPWAYLPGITSINQATAGTSGGQSWTHRPDTMSVWIRRTGDNTDKEDFYLLYYAWEKEAKGTSYKGKNGSCTSHSETNEESDVRKAMNGNECVTTVAGDQVCEGMWRERKTYGNWTNIKVPIYYFNDNVPRYMNIIFSASNYPNFRANNGLYEGNSLYVDDVELIYSSKIQTLRVGGKEWKGFDPNNFGVQEYAVPLGTTVTPTVEAYRGAGSLTNAKGTTKSFSGRKLSGSEITITDGVVGGTPTTIVVRAEDGSSTTTYRIKFVAAKSNNTKLAGISYTYTDKDGRQQTASISGFNPSTYNYNVELPYGSQGIPTVTCETQEDEQIVRMVPVSSVPGTAQLTVVAADGTIGMPYKVNFSIGKLADNTLADIKVNGNSIPGFTPSQAVYKVSLPTSTTTMPTIEAISAYPAGEQTIVHKAPSVIDGGTYTLSVTTPGNTIAKVYKLNFKLEASSYSYLQNLSVEGNYIADFQPDNFTYYINLPMGTTELPQISYTPGDNFQTVTIASLAPGVLDGTVRVTVTAGNGDQSVYKLVFSTEKSTDSHLAGIKIAGVNLPDFVDTVTTYSYNLPVGTTSLPTIEPIAGDEYQTITVTPGGLNGKTRITVQAGDGSTTIYLIVFSVQTFSENTLADLSVAGYDINFNENTTEYWVNLPQGTTVLPEVNYTLKDANFQTASVRSITGLSGDYKITVRPQSGASLTYIIHFTLAQSSNTALANLAVEGYTLNFDSAVVDYVVNLAEGVSKIPAVTFTKAENSQRVLSVLDDKVQTITVTAQSGATRVYTITFVVTVSENAFLQMIYLDSVPMADFAEQTLTYVRMLDGTTCPAITVDKYPGQQVTITAPHGAGVAQIRVQPEAGAANTYEITFTQGASASVRLDGINVNAVPLATFAPTTLQYALNYSGSLPVVEGVTSDSTLNVDVLWKGETASIQVTDPAGNIGVYTIVFTRQTSSNKALKVILINGSPLDKFTPAVLTYDSVLAAGSAYPEVTYIADEDAQVVFFGQLADGKWGISVVAEDGTMSTYTVQFTIAKYTNATLKNLTVEGKVIPFSPNTFNYNLSLDEGSPLPQVTPELREGQTVAQDNVNDSTQQVIVRAENGATNTYTISYARVQSNNALLADILIDGVSIAGFDPSITNYVDTLAWRTRFVPNVYPIAALSTQTITTYYSRPNGVTKIHVVAQDGVTTKDYFVAFPVRKSGNTLLGDLYLDSEDAELTFKPNQTDYEVRVPFSTTMAPSMVYEKDEPEQRIDVVSRPIGQTSQIIVHAENGDTRTYNITFKREVMKVKNLLTMLRVKELDLELSLKDKTKRDFEVTMPFGSRSLTVEYEKNYASQQVIVQPGGVHHPTLITVKANNDTIPDEVYTITPILEENNPAVITELTINGTPLEGFSPYNFSYIVPVENKHIVRYKTTKGAEINVIEQNEKHWQAEVTYNDTIVNTYDLWFYYVNDVLPNTEFTNWEAAAYNGSKPVGWNTLGNVTAGKSFTIIGTYTTGNEVVEATEGGEKCAKMETKYNAFPLGGFVPAYITLGNITADFSVAAGSDFAVTGGITFRNSPDELSVNFKQTKINNNSRIVYQMNGSLSSQEQVYLNTETQSSFTTIKMDLKATNEAAGVPQSMNVILNSFESEAGKNGLESGGATMFVNWARFAFNKTLTSMTVDGIATTKSGNAFTATLTDPERIEKPVLAFTGEVADQAQKVVWASPTKSGDFETRTATIRNFAENGTDYTDYTLTVKRPLDTKNELANILLDTIPMAGFSTVKTSYEVKMGITDNHVPDIMPIPSSSLQTITTVYNEADSTATITVTPEKGEAKVYTIKFKATLSNDSTLASITAEGLVYNPEQHSYELAADYMPLISFVKKSDLQVVTLNNGVISVTSEDGSATGIYTITCTKPVVAPNGTITEFSRGDDVVPGFGGTNYTKDEAKPDEAVSFIREQAADSVIFVQTEDNMSWHVPGTTKTYTWTYQASQSANAKLARILLNGVNYDEFDPNYSDEPYVIYSDSTLLVEFVEAEKKQTIATSMDEVSEGVAQGVEYTVTVTAQNGVTTKTYKVRVLTPKSNDATLAGILLDSVLIPGFVPDSTSYIVTLPLPADGVKRVQPQMPNVTYVAGHKGQTVTVEPGLLGTQTNFTVVSEDGSDTKYYDLTVNAEKSHCVDLTGITVNGEAIQGDKDEHFEPGRHFYSISLATSHIVVDYTSDDRFQTVTIHSDTLEEGSKYRYILHVVAEDGVTNTDYQLNVYVENQSNDATLADILLNGEKLADFERSLNSDLVFDPGQNQYKINLPSGTTIWPEVSAQLKMDGQTVAIDHHNDTVLLTVRAVDGSTNQYVLHFIVPLSKNADLSMIFLNGDSLPDFSPSYYFYQVNLPVGVHSLPEVAAQKGETSQTIKPIEIDEEKLQATIKVQAEDPEVRENTYVVVFHLTQSDADKLAMIYQDGQPIENFVPGTLYYALSLPVGTTAFPDLSWQEQDDWQTITMDTVETTPNSLIRQIYVTSESGKKTTYTVSYTIERSNVDTLQMIFVNQKQLPDFVATKNEYYVTLTSAEAAELDGAMPVVEYIQGDDDQQVLVTQDVDSLSGKSLGYKSVISVTAATGNTRIYTIHYPVQPSTEATLNMINLGGKPLANYDSERFTYRLEIEKEASIPVVSVIKKEEAQTYEIRVIEDTVQVVVIAEDMNYQQLYTLTFERLRSKVTTLRDIILYGEDSVRYASSQFPYRPEVYSYIVNLQFDHSKTLVEHLPAIEPVKYDDEQHIDTALHYLANGDLQYDLTVTAPNGEDEAVYTIVFHFVRPADATLVSLMLDGVELEDFRPTKTEYSYAHPFGTDSADYFTPEDVSFILSDTLATDSVYTDADGVLYVVVTAQDGSTSRTYLIYQTTALDGDNALAWITVDGDTLRDFDPEITFYTYLVYASDNPEVAAEARSENAEVDLGRFTVGDTCVITCTAADGSERLYRVYFQITEINPAEKASSDDVLIKRVPGASQLFIATMRAGVDFALYNKHGQMVYYHTALPTVAPNNVDMHTDAQNKEVLDDVVGYEDGIIIDVITGEPYFYVFFAEGKKISNGKLIVK